MSTTFGIPIRELKFNDKITDLEGELKDYVSEDFFNKVFLRGSQNLWLNSLASRLPDEVRVFALDNTAQGVYTIGDCKKLLKENKL